MAFPSKEQVHVIIEPVVAEFGLLVEHIKIAKAGAKSSVRIAVDTEHGATPDLDTVEEVSKAISETLDKAESEGTVNFGPGYTLEVSTPGVDFPLTEARHWRKNIGRLVRLPQGDKARVAQVMGDAVAFITSKKKDVEVTVLPLVEISEAVVEVEFAQVPQREADLVGLDWDAYQERS